MAVCYYSDLHEYVIDHSSDKYFSALFGLSLPEGFNISYYNKDEFLSKYFQFSFNASNDSEDAKAIFKTTGKYKYKIRELNIPDSINLKEMSRSPLEEDSPWLIRSRDILTKISFGDLPYEVLVCKGKGPIYEMHCFKADEYLRYILFNPETGKGYAYLIRYDT